MKLALARYRMPPLPRLPKPRLLLSVVWPSGLVRHYADIHRVWNGAFQGSIPAQARGVRMQVTPDDGTPEWAELYARAQDAPVQDRAL